jgi:hypothetical protein
VELKHGFLITCHDVKQLLKGCNKISTFVARVEKQSLLYPDRYDPMKYRGDALELFAEALIKLSPIDNRIGIGDYKIVEETDVGVDGVGIGTNNNPSTVQVKFRNDSRTLLTANTDHLSNFVTASILHYNVKPEDTKNMLVITTAKGLHHFTDNQMFLNKVRCLNYENLRDLVDNNLLFWNKFREMCKID